MPDYPFMTHVNATGWVGEVRGNKVHCVLTTHGRLWENPDEPLEGTAESRLEGRKGFKLHFVGTPEWDEINARIMRETLRDT